MRVTVFTEPHRGASYDDQLRFAQTVEACGFEGYFRADHYQSMGTDPGLPGPTDAWLTLAALARETSRIRLGTLVTSATFRLPGPLAVMVAQADQMSGGRIELGIGTGWYEREHSAYGIPFPPLAERFDRLEEQLAVITGLWSTPRGEKFSYDGHYYPVADSPALPKPVQAPRPPILIGGMGRKRTPQLTARYADEFNLPFASAADSAVQFDRVRAACAEIGRDPAQLCWSNALVLCCGRDDAEV
ncbi:LLM class F420-dependent oxidoreductase, partial [Micromonospora azadirachtae]